MQQQFKFDLPPCLNEQTNAARTHWAVSSKIKKEWTNLIAVETWGKKQFPEKVWIGFRWRVKFTRDPDNVAASAKYILDGLTKAKILKGDNLNIIQSPVLHWYNKIEKGESESVIISISSDPLLIVKDIVKEFGYLLSMVG